MTIANEWIASQVPNFVTGKNAKILISFGDNALREYGECSRWELNMSIATSDTYAIGYNVAVSYDQNVTYNLSVEEIVLRSDVIAYILENYRQAKTPIFAFQSTVERRDGLRETFALRNVTLAGDVKLQNLVPTDLYVRSLSFRVSTHPDLLEKFTV